MENVTRIRIFYEEAVAASMVCGSSIDPALADRPLNLRDGAIRVE
jgi:hypothetical protein